MAITSNDCLLLLSNMKKNGIDTQNYIAITANSITPKIQVIKFINQNRQFDLQKFYQKLRKSYNNKKSILYKNIVRQDLPTQQIMITLSSLCLQILLFTKQLQDKQMFLKHARFQEISMCLFNYSKTFDLIPCIQMLKLIKADLKLFQYLRKNK